MSGAKEKAPVSGSVFAMAKINQELLAAIRKKTGLSVPGVYARIQHVATTEYLPRHLAAIKVGADCGVAIQRYASHEELAELRRAGSPVAPPTIAVGAVTEQSVRIAPQKRKIGRPNRGRSVPNQVFVVHGRDLGSKDAVFAFLRSLGITPIEWTSAIRMTKKATPYVGEILDAAFSKARAVIVLLTPDDQAQLRQDLLVPHDPPFERSLTGQARPNVLFECGMAFASHPDRTVMLQIGSVRPFSDTFGRHILNMTNAPEKRQEFAAKLENAGCDVNQSGTDWLKVGDFSDPLTKRPARTRRKV